MLGIITGGKRVRTLLSFLMAAVLVLGLASCGDRAASQTPEASQASQTQLAGQISEVAPPEAIQQLRPYLDAYQPQVTILGPRGDEILQDTTVEVRFQVEDLPIFKNPDLGLGPHLHVILDNQPNIPVYDLNKPVVLENLSPGTHTLRVFAIRPWDESFKNEGAYAQTTFHIFTKTTDNNPNPSAPLLTYSSPTGSVGTQPILLDFYLTNAPLHEVAQENPTDDIADWRIRVTINNQSFVLDKWQPIYLKGFNPGKNWVHLEFIDELGNPVKNVFNDTVRLITYEPKGKDTLSKLVRGEISAESARGIVEPNYTVKLPAATPTPTATEPTPTPTPTPTPAPTPTPTPTPTVEQTPTGEPETPEVSPTQPAEPVPTELKQTEKPKSGGFFSRLRRPAASPSVSPTLPEAIETPTPAPVEPESPAPTLAPVVTPAPTVEETPADSATPTETKQPEKSKYGDLFSRWRRPAASPSLPPTLPEIVQTPTPAPVAPNSPLRSQEFTKAAAPLEETPKLELPGVVQEQPNPELAAPKSSEAPADSDY